MRADINDTAEVGDDAIRTVACWLTPATSGDVVLDRVLERLPPGMPLVVGIPEDLGATLIDESGDGQTIYRVKVPPGGTLAHVANHATESWPNADLALIFPHVTLPESWLSRLEGAAISESTAGTASALLRDTIARSEVGLASGTSHPVPADAAHGSTRDSAAAVAVASRKLYPRLAAILPSCVYLRRAALELVGPLDEELGSSYAAVLDFAFRARGRGLANLLADDLLVDAPPVELSGDDLDALKTRHPSLMAVLDQTPGPAVERSLTLASVALEPLTVTVDARALGPYVGGTQVYLLRLLESLASGGEVQLRVLVPPDLASKTEASLRTLAGVELLTYEQALARPEPSHVVHRPQQVFSPDDLMLLRLVGKRVVITHQDLIAYHNPTYFPSFDLWQRFVRTTREALAVADHVLFFSRHALHDASREDLIDTARCTVGHLGVDLDERSSRPPLTPTLAPPPCASSLGSTPFLLCIGADYQHKNRPFALAVLDELRREHAWPGAIVFAGPHVEHGSSAAQEEKVRERRSMPHELVIDLEVVSDSERSWLMSNTAAVIYPTVHEGFGLVPFESAVFGVPCLFAAQSSLMELLDAELATLVSWDPVRSAARAASLLTDGPERREHVKGLLQAARSLRWSDCAKTTVDAYRKAIAAPYRATSEGAWQALEREREIVRLNQGVEDLDARVRYLSDELGSDALALVGPHALLSRSDQHALLAVAARPTLRRLLFGGLRGGFRTIRAMRGPQR
ncbi:MAG TPA: hypothetical protein VGX26_08165 [Solirubrobacteraceae bacterium]|jgi:glycosyltransferase involved in cell wall biosynthesis|nr:hypothetical protein [Solirubrobacteraceae bacterium]